MEEISTTKVQKKPKEIKSLLESILFVSSKPLGAKELSKFTEIPLDEILPALNDLKKEKEQDGVVLLESPEGFQLATNSANSTMVKNFLNAELREKLTDATVEVLAIIAYRQPISKAEIEAIRGVNSQYSVRHLLMRGLIEKTANPQDARSFLYQTTTEFLQHLGITSVADLPEFKELVSQIKLPQTPILEDSNTPEQPLKEDLEIAEVNEVVEKIDPNLPGESSEVQITEIDVNSTTDNPLIPSDENS